MDGYRMDDRFFGMADELRGLSLPLIVGESGWDEDFLVRVLDSFGMEYSLFEDREHKRFDVVFGDVKHSFLACHLLFTNGFSAFLSKEVVFVKVNPFANLGLPIMLKKWDEYSEDLFDDFYKAQEAVRVFLRYELDAYNALLAADSKGIARYYTQLTGTGQVLARLLNRIESF